MKLNPKDYPYYAAGIQTVQYGHAGFVYMSWVGVATAGLLGLLVSFGTAIAASKINDIAKKRKPAAWVALILLLVVSPAFVGVGMWLALDVITDPLWRVVVAALWGLIPDGSVALVGFISGKGLVADAKQTATQQVQPATKLKQKKSKMAEPATCPHCGLKKTLGAINAHKGKCEKNPANQFAKMAKAER